MTGYDQHNLLFGADPPLPLPDGSVASPGPACVDRNTGLPVPPGVRVEVSRADGTRLGLVVPAGSSRQHAAAVLAWLGGHLT